AHSAPHERRHLVHDESFDPASGHPVRIGARVGRLPGLPPGVRLAGELPYPGAFIVVVTAWQHGVKVTFYLARARLIAAHDVSDLRSAAEMAADNVTLVQIRRDHSRSPGLRRRCASRARSSAALAP